MCLIGTADNNATVFYTFAVLINTEYWKFDQVVNGITIFSQPWKTNLKGLKLMEKMNTFIKTWGIMSLRNSKNPTSVFIFQNILKQYPQYNLFLTSLSKFKQCTSTY